MLEEDGVFSLRLIKYPTSVQLSKYSLFPLPLFLGYQNCHRWYELSSFEELLPSMLKVLKECSAFDMSLSYCTIRGKSLYLHAVV